MSTANKAIVKAPGQRMRLPMREALEAASRSMPRGLAAEYLKAADKAASASTIATRSRVPTLAGDVESSLPKTALIEDLRQRARASLNSPALAELAQQFLARSGLGANLRPEVAELAEEHLRHKGLSANLGSQVTRLAEQRLGASMSAGMGADVQRLAEVFPSSKSFNFTRNQRDLERIQRRFPTLARSLPGVRGSLMLGAGASGAAMLTRNHPAIARMLADHARPTTLLAASTLAEHFAASADIRWSQSVAAGLLEQRFAGAGSRGTFDLNAPLTATRQQRGVVAEPAPPAPVPRSRDPHPAPHSKPSRRPDHQTAPMAASCLAERDRRMVVAFLDEAELEREREHLEALEERLRVGHAAARNHMAISARQLLLGVANHCFPARSGLYACRFNCSHEVGPNEVANRISAFVDQRLRSELDTREQKLFQAKLDWVFRWGGRGTHEDCTSEEALLGFLRLLEVLAMIARASGISPRLTLDRHG